MKHLITYNNRTIFAVIWRRHAQNRRLWRGEEGNLSREGPEHGCSLRPRQNWNERWRPRYFVGPRCKFTVILVNWKHSLLLPTPYGQQTTFSLYNFSRILKNFCSLKKMKIDIPSPERRVLLEYLPFRYSSFAMYPPADVLKKFTFLPKDGNNNRPIKVQTSFRIIVSPSTYVYFTLLR